jgi:ubiquinone/menaquinone biosynthesis C-methylase UbiE
LNYGYFPSDPKTEKLELDEADEPNRVHIQLYHHVASTVNLKDLDVLEVSCGRGGGSYYIKHYLKPKTMVGVDFCKKGLAFCNEHYSAEGLSFKAGDAESLPFEDNSFDVVINVESSHCYGSMDAFLMQVRRVLRQGGYLLFADFREKYRIDMLHQQLRGSGMTLIKEENITPNVLEAMKLENKKKMACLSTISKLWLRTSEQFIGVEDSSVYKGFREGSMIYLSVMMQKLEN